MLHFRGPLLRDVFQTVGAVNGEAHEDDVSVRVGERPQAIIVFLPCCVPQGQLHLLAVHLDVCDVVLKDGGDVDLWELILAEDDEETGLPTGPVPHNH